MSTIPLIVCCPLSGNYSVTEEAVEFLSSLSNKPLGVITIAGKYRTGKSLFLNRVLLQKRNAFNIGSSVNACTKGIWLYTEPIKTPEGLDVLVLDSEGIGSLDADATHDSRVFALAILLSSLFIYNSVGSIDDSALQALSLVTNISKQIKVSAENETTTDDLAKVFPSFCWIVRDFSLRLENRQGDSINADTYLESALISSNPSDDVGHVKKVISNCFVERMCMTMVRPCQEEDDLQNLDNMDNQELRPVFVEQMEEIREKLMAQVRIKDYLGHSVTGNMLVALAKQYVVAINAGVAPVIKDSWKLMSEIQNRDVMDTALNKFVARVSNVSCGTRNPKDYKNELDEIFEYCVSYFEKNVMESSPGIKQKLEVKMSHHMETALEKNEEGLRTSLSLSTEAVSRVLAKGSKIPDIMSEITGLRFMWEVDYCDYTDNMWNSAMISLLYKYIVPLAKNQEQQIIELEKLQDKVEEKCCQLETKLTESEQREAQAKQDRSLIESDMEQCLADLTGYKTDCANLAELVKEMEQNKSEDATLQLKLVDAEKNLEFLRSKLQNCEETYHRNEEKYKSTLDTLQSQALDSLNQSKFKNQKLMDKMTIIECDSNRWKQNNEKSQTIISNQCEVIKKSENQVQELKASHEQLLTKLHERDSTISTYQEKVCQLQDTNAQIKSDLNTKIKELETEKVGESINFINCKKRLAEVQASSDKHKKLKIDLHRSTTEMEKHKSLADWLVKDKEIKEDRISELQNQVNELEKRCYDIQKQCEIDILQMKLVVSH